MTKPMTERPAGTPAWVEVKKFPFTRTPDGEKLEIIYNGRDNPSCPRCKHYNALLFKENIWVEVPEKDWDEPDVVNGSVMTGYYSECRDCHLVVEFSSFETKEKQ